MEYKIEEVGILKNNQISTDIYDVSIDDDTFSKIKNYLDKTKINNKVVNFIETVYINLIRNEYISSNKIKYIERNYKLKKTDPFIHFSLATKTIQKEHFPIISNYNHINNVKLHIFYLEQSKIYLIQKNNIKSIIFKGDLDRCHDVLSKI